MTAAFDTLEFAERLKAGGFTEQQAKAATEAFAKATSQQLVTKADLREEMLKLDRRIDGVERRIDGVEVHLGGRINSLSARIDGVEVHLGGQIDSLGARIDSIEVHLGARIDDVQSQLQAMEQRLLMRLGGLAVAGIGIIATLVAIF